MENNENQPESNQQVQISKEQMLAEIYEFTKKTHKYLKWQLYITLVLVVLPLLAMVFILPMIMKTLGSVYGGAGLLQ